MARGRGLDWDRDCARRDDARALHPVATTTRAAAFATVAASRAQTFLDLQLAVDLGKLAGRQPLLRGVEFAVGASNLLDQQPDFAEVIGVQGYDTSQGDLKGRFWYVRLGKTF